MSEALKLQWRSQPQHPTPVDIEAIRRKAQTMQGRKRWATPIGLVLGVTIIGLYIPIFRSPSLLMRAAGVIAILWTLAYMWKMRQLGVVRAVPEDAAACNDFHRSELERQRIVLRRAFRFFLPVGATIILVALGRLFEAPAPWRAPWLDHLFIALSVGFGAETMVLLWLFFEDRADRLGDQIRDLEGVARPQS